MISRMNTSSYLTKKGLLREILGELIHLKPSQPLYKEKKVSWIQPRAFLCWDEVLNAFKQNQQTLELVQCIVDQV